MTPAKAANSGRSLTVVRDVFESLLAWGEARSWIGGDPYEGLNAPLARIAPGVRARQAVIQLYKRLPFAPPWPLSAPRRANAKALGLVLSTFSTPAGAQVAPADAASRLAARLAQMRLPAANGWGWGYPFDAQTRHLRYRATVPNAIATCFVVESLVAHAEHEGSDASFELALGSRPFLRSLLHRPPGTGPYFAYAPGGSRLIHNANVLVCGALARLHAIAPDDAAANGAIEAAETTISAQDERGLWPYGVGSNLGWADNFHTAYILEGLHATASVFGVGMQALEAGLPEWRSRFFDDSAGARLYPDSPYPLEAHSFASAIDLCCTAHDLDPSLIEFGCRIAERAIDLLWLPDEGRFAYRVTALGINRREFMRWTNAPMLRALARLLSVAEQRQAGSSSP